MHRFELADAVAANIEQRQAGFLEILRRANDDFPSLLPLIGYFALAQQSQEELERLVQPDQQQLNESFAFMTFVTRTADSRAGLLFRSRETLQDELRHAQEAISERGVSEQLVLQLRSYERLTNVLLYAISYVEQLLRAEPKTQDLPKSVRVIGKFARAEAAIESAIRDYDAPRAAPLSAEIKEANRLRNESWRALSDAQGGMFDQLEVVDRNADLILAKLGRSRPSI